MPPTLLTLPPELHLAISQHLPYPDALSLKHTSRHFYALVDTGVRLKVAWLIDRRRMHLECPSHGQCRLKSDEEFCASREIRRLMARRRRHEECGGLKGCVVVGVGECDGGGWALLWWMRRRRTRVGLGQAWLVVLAVAVVWVSFRMAVGER